MLLAPMAHRKVNVGLSKRSSSKLEGSRSLHITSGQRKEAEYLFPTAIFTGSKRSFRKKSKCSAKYHSFGSTSDLKPADMSSDNPYEELERDIQKTNNMRAMKDSMSWLNLRRRQQKSSDAGGDEDRGRREGPEGGPSTTAAAGNEEEEEDDEEESGAPQAMRMPDPKESAKPQVEKLRDVKVWVAEKIVKEMEPNDLIEAIRSRGFFNYNYLSHARRRTDATGTSTSTTASRNNEIDVLYAVLGMSRSRKQNKASGVRLHESRASSCHVLCDLPTSSPGV